VISGFEDPPGGGFRDIVEGGEMGGDIGFGVGVDSKNESILGSCEVSSVGWKREEEVGVKREPGGGKGFPGKREGGRVFCSIIGEVGSTGGNVCVGIVVVLKSLDWTGTCFLGGGSSSHSAYSCL
jgi:hypothetical protein